MCMKDDTSWYLEWILFDMWHSRYRACLIRVTAQWPTSWFILMEATVLQTCYCNVAARWPLVSRWHHYCEKCDSNTINMRWQADEVSDLSSDIEAHKHFITAFLSSSHQEQNIFDFNVLLRWAEWLMKYSLHESRHIDLYHVWWLQQYPCSPATLDRELELYRTMT